MTAIVYLATNRVNGKRYIGATSKRLPTRRRQQEHRAKISAGLLRASAARRQAEGSP